MDVTQKHHIIATNSLDHPTVAEQRRWFEKKVRNEIEEVVNHPLDSISRSQVSDLKTVKLKARSSASSIAGLPPTIYRPQVGTTLKWTLNSKIRYQKVYHVHVDNQMQNNGARFDDLWHEYYMPIDEKIPFVMIRTEAGRSLPYAAYPQYIYRQKMWWTDP